MKKIFAILAGLALAIGSLSAQELANFSFGFGRQKPVISPEIKNDSVTFRLKADYATVVKLSGSWMPNPYGGTIDMKRGENNVWEVTIPCPEPEIYTYNFVADGVSVNDPQNVMVQRDGSRFLNMLLIDGERTENYKPANQRGTISHPWYDSKILGINRRLTVYTPYGYEANTKTKYPVLYLLHGAGGDEEAWSSMGRTAQILDNLIEKGLAEPMIVVMPNGNGNQQAAQTYGLPNAQMDWRDPSTRNNYVKSLCEEIVPFIEKNYRVVAKKSHRAIAGLSMGGIQTLEVIFQNPDKFGYVWCLSGGFNPGVDIAKEAERLHVKEHAPIINKNCKEFVMTQGGKSDITYISGEKANKLFDEVGLKYEYQEVGEGHTWYTWRINLYDEAQRLFKKK